MNIKKNVRVKSHPISTYQQQKSQLSIDTKVKKQTKNLGYLQDIYFFKQFLKIIYLFIWLCWVFVAARAFLLLQQVGATLQVVVRGILIVVASFVVEHRLQGAWPSVVVARGFTGCGSGLQSTGSIAVAQGLSCFLARGIFLDQGSNLCLLN